MKLNSNFSQYVCTISILSAIGLAENFCNFSRCSLYAKKAGDFSVNTVYKKTATILPPYISYKTAQTLRLGCVLASCTLGLNVLYRRCKAYSV